MDTLTNFKNNMVYLSGLLQNIIIDNSQKHPELPKGEEIAAVTAFLEKASAKGLLYRFVVHSYDYWPHIKRKDRKFFAENVDSIFGASEKLKTQTKGLRILFSKEGVVDEKNFSIISRKIRQMVRQSIIYMISEIGDRTTIEMFDLKPEFKLTKDILVKLKSEWEPTKTEDEQERLRWEKS